MSAATFGTRKTDGFVIWVDMNWPRRTLIIATRIINFRESYIQNFHIQYLISFLKRNCYSESHISGPNLVLDHELSADLEDIGVKSSQGFLSVLQLPTSESKNLLILTFHHHGSTGKIIHRPHSFRYFSIKCSECLICLLWRLHTWPTPSNNTTPFSITYEVVWTNKSRQWNAV